MPVEGFFGKNRFLSNFWPVVIYQFGQEFSSVEHAYMANKCDNPEDRSLFTSDKNLTPAQAKRLGKTIKLKPHWDEIKLEVMEDLVRAKFRKNPLRQMLMDTGDAELIEKNCWSDFYWGVCNGKGENHLGKIIMKIRKELLDQNKNHEKHTK